jgi:hypothetical protein
MCNLWSFSYCQTPSPSPIRQQGVDFVSPLTLSQQYKWHPHQMISLTCKIGRRNLAGNFITNTQKYVERAKIWSGIWFKVQSQSASKAKLEFGTLAPRIVLDFSLDHKSCNHGIKHSFWVHTLYNCGASKPHFKKSKQASSTK